MPERNTPNKKVVFALAAPAAARVQIAGDFTGWQESPVDLKKLKNGTWKATLSLKPGRYEYRFMVDGDWQDDPTCEVRAPNAFGSENCVLVLT